MNEELKPKPIDFTNVLDYARNKMHLMQQTAEYLALHAKWRGDTIEDYETIEYIGFKNVTFLINLVCLDGEVKTAMTIKQDKGINELLPELAQDLRVDYDRSEYLASIEVEI